MTAHAGRSRHYHFVEVQATTRIRTVNPLDRLFTLPSEPVTWFLLNFTGVSANALSLLGGLFGLLGALLFYRELWLAAGVAYGLFFILDCCDGAVARLTGQASPFGARLDLTVDRAVLLITTLSRAAYYLQHGELLAGFLCAGFLASQYVVDLRWLMRLREKAELPRQTAALLELLRARLRGSADREQASSPPARTAAGMIFNGALQILPSNWVCNIAFSWGGCFVPHSPVALFAAAALGLQWDLPVDGLHRLARRRRKDR